DVRATGTSRTGAPSVPISETFSGTSNWSLGAVSINPSTADIAVSTSVSAVPLGQNSTYNITITNNGPLPARIPLPPLTARCPRHSQVERQRRLRLWSRRLRRDFIRIRPPLRTPAPPPIRILATTPTSRSHQW
ncbi:MAG: hypothetical protein DMG78_24170, partial [Acidobacteria bacterium]